MPILPVLKMAAKFAPLSVCALFGTRPFAPHLLELLEHVLDAVAGQRVVVPLAGSIFEPAATIIGEVVKILQPGQAPEK